MTQCFRLAARKPLRVILALVLSFSILIWLSPSWIDLSTHRIAKFDLALDTSNHAVAERICRSHGWPAFKPAGHQRRKVYDLFMVNTELDWLEIRLNTTYDLVDYFVIVESPRTFTNLPKQLTIKENWEKFAPYHSKLIYHELEIPDGFNPPRTWDWEDLQRNAMYKQVLPRLKGDKMPIPGDVIIVADVDEIVRPETLIVLRACDFPKRLTLRSKFYYYSFQFLHKGVEWAHPQATYYQGSRTILPVNLRNSDGGFPPLVRLEKGELWNAAWHCSGCFSTIEEMLTKMSSFSHQWMNHESFRDRDRIADRVRSGNDLWDRKGEEYERIQDNRDVPDFLLKRPGSGDFTYLLNRDGPSAGFKDYP